MASSTAVTQRIAMGLSYDGTRYQGWQRQPHTRMTVETQTSLAISKIANHPVTLYCAGRTDAGVHAKQQVIHFDTTCQRSNREWLQGSNNYLPNDIAIHWVKPVDNSFHARFSAKARSYQYVIDNSPVRSALLRQYMGWYGYPLNEAHMHQAAQALIGKHDFSAFRGRDCQAKSAIRQIYRLDITRDRQLVIVSIQANAFLLHMVRNIVGSLLQIGGGKKPINWLKQVLLSQDRCQAGMTFSPQGLYLTHVIY